MAIGLQGKLNPTLPFVVCLLLINPASSHVAIWHPSMYGFNVVAETFSYDNRPVVPLTNMPFSQWWFHGHLDYPPQPDQVLNLPAGQSVTLELACDKGYTSYYASSSGGDIRSSSQPNYPCPGAPTSEFHTTDESDVTGCALAIAPKSNARDVQPEDFVIFSVNHKCVWTKFTKFPVPVNMPECPSGGCTCAWFWIHSPDSGAEQMYMNAFKCTVTGAKTNAPALSKPKIAKRCGYNPVNRHPANPDNCTIGAKQPFYWYQAERNNMFEGTYAPPFYNGLYGFKDGAQNDIFENEATVTAQAGTGYGSTGAKAKSHIDHAPKQVSRRLQKRTRIPRH